MALDNSAWRTSGPPVSALKGLQIQEVLFDTILDTAVRLCTHDGSLEASGLKVSLQSMSTLFPITRLPI
jgi:hypothetical protein